MFNSMTPADAAVAFTCIGLIATLLYRTRKTLKDDMNKDKEELKSEIGKKADKTYVDKMFTQHQERENIRMDGVHTRIKDLAKHIDTRFDDLHEALRK